MQNNHYTRKWKVLHEFESFSMGEITAGFVAGFFVVLWIIGLFLVIPNDAPREARPTDQKIMVELLK